MKTSQQDAVSIIANRKPFSSETLRTGWFSTKTKIYYHGEFFGDVTDKDLGKDIVLLLNAATMLGSSSGYSYASCQEDISKIDLTNDTYKPYTLEISKETDYNYSIAFEEEPMRYYVNISREALNNTVKALNQAHALGYKDGVKLAELEKQNIVNKVNKLEEMFNSPSASI